MFDDASEVFGGKDSLFGDFEDDVIDFQSSVLCGAIEVDPSDGHPATDGQFEFIGLGLGQGFDAHAYFGATDFAEGGEFPGDPLDTGAWDCEADTLE